MNRLKELRERAGIKQNEMAALIDVPRIDTAMVSRFENGVCLPTEEVMVRLEKILGADRYEIFAEGEERVEKAVRPAIVDRVLNVIPYGAANAVTREELARRLGMSDRKARQCIETARRYGILIMNRQDGRGYFISDNVAEMERQYRQDTRRALSILARRKAVRKRIKELGGQL